MARETIRFPRSHAAGPRGATEKSAVGVWGVGTWSASATWGRNDGQRTPAFISPTASTGYWNQHSWQTDFFVRWS